MFLMFNWISRPWKVVLVGLSASLASLGMASSYNAVILSSPGCSLGEAESLSSTQEVGFGTNENSNLAFLWTGQNSPRVLNPPHFNAVALAACAYAQVGYVWDVPNRDHAVMWKGSAASIRYLEPRGALTSEANAVSTHGTYQAGEVKAFFGGIVVSHHAFLWKGTAGSALDLNPRGEILSTANAVAEPSSENSFRLTVGGWALGNGTGFQQHAYLFYPSQGQSVDLAPVGTLLSEVDGMAGP